MDEELKISKTLEEQEKQQDKFEVNQALEEEVPKSEGKTILIAFLVIVGVFALTLSGWKVYDHFTAASVVNIDDLHQENLEGKLDPDEGYIYNGFSVVNSDGLWWTEIQRSNTLIKIPLRHGPLEVENISMIGQLSPDFYRIKQVYISLDPNVSDRYYVMANSQLSFNLISTGIDRIPVGAWSEENNWGTNHSIVSCKNNSKRVPVIQLSWKNETKIELKDTCILVQGQGDELVKAVERLIYDWYGVIS